MDQYDADSNMIPVSVIIPVYNSEKYLRRCLDSVLGQTFAQFECILVDDCSADHSPLIMEEYAQRDKRIRIIRNKQNMGSSQTRRAGLKAAQGVHVLFVDSDDWCECNMLEVLYNKARSENIDMVFCNFYADRPKKYPNVNIIKGLGNEDIIALMFRTLKPFVWNKLVKRDIYLQCSFPTASYAEDFYIIIQAISYAKNVGYVEDFLYHYCYNPSSVCEDPNNFEQQRLDLHTNTRNIVNFLKARYGDKAKQFKSAHNECLKHHMEKYDDKTFADYDL